MYLHSHSRIAAFRADAALPMPTSSRNARDWISRPPCRAMPTSSLNCTGVEAVLDHASVPERVTVFKWLFHGTILYHTVWFHARLNRLRPWQIASAKYTWRNKRAGAPRTPNSWTNILSKLHNSRMRPLQAAIGQCDKTGKTCFITKVKAVEVPQTAR